MDRLARLLDVRSSVHGRDRVRIGVPIGAAKTLWHIAYRLVPNAAPDATTSVTGMRCLGANVPAAVFYIVAYGATIGTEAPGARSAGRPMLFDEPRARVSSWPPLRLARLRWGANP